PSTSPDPLHRRVSRAGAGFAPGGDRARAPPGGRGPDARRRPGRASARRRRPSRRGVRRRSPRRAAWGIVRMGGRGGRHRGSAGAAALGLGSRLGLIHSAGHAWARSTGGATNAVLVPLLSLDALLGAAVFAAAAVLLGIVLRAGHLALALLGALIWAAGLEGAL